MRIDKFIAEKGTYTRSRAALLIKEGAVSVNGKTVKAPSYDVSENDFIEIDNSFIKYVSRGGLKLEYALDFWGIDPSGLKAVDIGASTGGFTDVLLMRGAKCVYAIDSGSDQLAHKLKNDERVVSVEGFNAREMTTEITNGECDIAVCDLSFISQTLIYPALTRVLKKGGIFITLIKPQFEVGRSLVGKGGIVRDERAREDSVQRVIDTAKNYGLSFRGRTVSPIKGGDGNTEYLAFFIYE